MHPNPGFRKATKAQNIEFARARSFGTLAINHADGPLLSHIPFLLSEDGNRLEFHLVRSNPILKDLEPGTKALISVAGPDSYISPDWYEMDDQVPTWNYVSVHLRGTLTRLPDDTLPDILARLSHQFESRLAPKPIWKQDKMTPDVLAKMLRMIVPLAIDITSIDGTWKLGQNKSDSARLKAAQKVEEAGIGAQVQLLANLMKSPPA